MRALTVRQPWAGAICDLGKRLENRSRPPPRTLPCSEVIAIRAGSADTRATEAEHVALTLRAVEEWGLRWTSRAAICFGCVVATCRVVGWWELVDGKPWAFSRTDGEALGAPIASPYDSAADWAEAQRQLARWWIGPFAWVLRDVQVLAQPVPAKGALGLRRVPDDVEAAVRAAEKWRRP